jgi:hypothetical protein
MESKLFKRMGTDAYMSLDDIALSLGDNSHIVTCPIGADPGPRPS